MPAVPRLTHRHSPIGFPRLDARKLGCRNTRISFAPRHCDSDAPIDTDMSRGADIPKSSAESVARNILDGVEKGEDEIFPDPASGVMTEGWYKGVAKALERRYAAFAAELSSHELYTC